METVGTLKEAVLAFVYNNTNANDALLGATPKESMDEFMDKVALRAINNARLWAERGHDFAKLQVTVPAYFPVGMGINLDRLYLPDYDHEPSGQSAGATPAYVTIAGTAEGENGTISFPGQMAKVGAHNYIRVDEGSTFMWDTYLGQWMLHHGPSGVEWISLQPISTPYEDIVWTTTYELVGPNDFVITEFEAIPAETFKFRWTGNGSLLIAIPEDTAWWNGADKTKLQSIVLGEPGDIALDGMVQGEHAVWGLEDDLTIDSVVYKVYRTATWNSNKTRPTAWAEGFEKFGPAYFCDYCRMNNLQGAGFTNSEGAFAGPMEIKTQTGKRKREQMVGRRWWNWNNETDRNRAWTEGESFAIIQGTTLALNPIHSTTQHTVLFGIRWMDTYTSDSDTDFIIQDGFDFMMWQAILELNKIVKEFVPRTEGSLPEPTRSRDEAWANFTANDVASTTAFYQD